jgi:hypothetical protein
MRIVVKSGSDGAVFKEKAKAQFKYASAFA